MSLTHSPFAAIHSRTFFSSQLFVSALALSGLLISVDTSAQTAPMVDKLKRNEQISCKPIEPNFCLNMHVSCAGKTNYQAFAFNLQATEKKGDLTVAKEFDQFSDLYASANVQWSSDNTYVIFSPANGKGYIKMFDNGKYVFRYYPVNQEGIMSLGMCQ